MFASKDLMFGQQSGGYQISRSVRTRASASAYFNRTIGTPTNNKICTFSFWAKRGALQSAGSMGIIGTSGGDYIDFNNDNMEIRQLSGGGGRKITTAVFRDPSAWYHFVFQLDTTDATAANRIKIWQNGVQLTSFSTSSDPSQNSTWSFNVASAAVRLATDFSSYFDGYLTEMYFIDGQSLAPTSFGAFDAVTGVWNPKAYSGTYGTNGFYLNFKDPTSTTTIAYDYSGNSNNWTANNISVTAGSTYDSMVDAPTNYGTDTAGTGATARGNYAVLNPLDSSAVTVSNGNLRVTYPGSDAWRGIRATMPVPKTGSWKWEVIPTTMTYSFIGLAMPSATLSTSGFTTTYVYAWYLDSGEIRYSDVNVATGKTVSVNDVVEVRVNNATVSFYKNNTLQWTFTQLLTDITPDYFPVTWMFNGAVQNYNFGQQPFVYTVAGYKALCTQNLPTATVSNGANYVAASLYTGTGASQTVSNAVNSISFQPDLVWIKSRSAATNNKLTDSVRGATKAVISNTSGAETTDTNGLTAFGSSGFTVGTDTVYNNSGATYVGWNWKGGGTAVTNNDGNRTASVSANTTAGFSVVTYTFSTSATNTIGHGLGVAPSMLLSRNRTVANNWDVYHISLGYTQRLILNDTGAASGGGWAATPTSTVFSVTTGLYLNNDNIVTYCFAPITGYSAFGSYVGNGSTDGTFVYCGFRPRWILAKSTSTGYWHMFDSARPTYNPETLVIYANIADAEATVAGLDFLSNGFKLRYGNAGINGSGDTIVYAAFAENPFTLARAR